MTSGVSATGVSFYSLGDELKKEDLLKLGFESLIAVRCSGYEVVAVVSKKRRILKAGEWYLSGAIPTAYRAINDLFGEFHIMQLMLMTQTIQYDLFERAKEV